MVAKISFMTPMIHPYVLNRGGRGVVDLSIAYETGVLHSAVRMLGCMILQPNRSRTGLEHEVQGYSTSTYFEGWAVSVDSVIDCSVLQCLPVVLGSLIVVRPHTRSTTDINLQRK